MNVPALIERKREGRELASGEIAALIAGYTAGAVPDYQMSAFAMAVFFRGLSDAETAELTAAMRDSGSSFEWPEGTPPKVDKHSTGGIGDKVSLLLAPLLACDGLWVPMVSGRGLGITGGTLDKLESIPGFCIHLDQAAGLRQLEKIGVFMAGQSDGFCPADKKLYALRDVTGTVPSRELIIASIMSKKLAESLDRLVLDVKFGSGAFMKTREDAERLAAGLCDAGLRNGVETSFVLSPMDEPLGRSAGNALEVRETVEVLRGGGPADLIDLTLDLACRVSTTPRETHAARLAGGAAYQKFLELVAAQGGDVRSTEEIEHLHPAKVIRPLLADRSGQLRTMDAGVIGRVCVELGAGRKKTSDTVDPSVGVAGICKCGASVTAGEPLLFVHAASESAAESALQSLRDAVGIV